MVLLSNMNAFADRKSDFSKMIGFIFERVTNILGKGENACHHHFLVCQGIFNSLTLHDCWNSGFRGKKVNPLPHNATF